MTHMTKELQQYYVDVASALQLDIQTIALYHKHFDVIKYILDNGLNSIEYPLIRD